MSATRSTAGSCSRISACSSFGRSSRMVTASSESSSRTPSATVSGGSSSRISSRTVSSTWVSAVKSKSAPISAIRRGRSSGSSASMTRADVGLMQLADQLAQRRRVAGIERLDDLLDIVRAQRSRPSSRGATAGSVTACLSRRACRAFKLTALGGSFRACTPRAFTVAIHLESAGNRGNAGHSAPANLYQFHRIKSALSCGHLVSQYSVGPLSSGYLSPGCRTGAGITGRMRSAVAFSCLLASLIAAAPASASECPGNPGALGTSRTIVVDPSEHNLLGGHQYRESLPLNDKEVVITFDDGPLPPYTHPHPRHPGAGMREGDLLHGRAHGARVSRRSCAAPTTKATRSPTTARAIRSTSTGCRSRTPRAKSRTASQSIAAAVGDPAKVAPFFRFPGLLRQDSVEHYLRSKRVMAWSVDFMADDWTRINAREIVRRALERLEAKGKGILLLHDIQPATALGLPELLRELKARGYRVVHVVPATAGPARPPSPPPSNGWCGMPPSREQVASASRAVAARRCRIACEPTATHCWRRRASRASAPRRTTTPCR